MEPNPLLDVINQAAAGHQWVLLAVAGLALIVPVVLHALGKNIPIVSTILNALVEVVKGMKTVPPAPKQEDQKGIGTVVQIEDARKPPEQK